MLYEKPVRRINSAVYAAIIAVLAAPFVLLVAFTKSIEAVSRWGWWQAYWGRVQWHDDQARQCGTKQRAKRWGHYAMMWLLGAPVWVPVILLALWGLEKADR
jgi:hypothetical protein